MIAIDIADPSAGLLWYSARHGDGPQHRRIRALAASGALPFEDALLAVSARGRGMARVSFADNGKMAAVFAPIAEVERILKSVKGYVVIANVNSNTQSVIGGAKRSDRRGDVDIP